MESGRLAALAVIKAHEEGERGEDALSYYSRLLDDSVILKSLRKFSKAPRVLSKRELYKEYPRVLCGILGSVYTTREEPFRLYDSIKASLKEENLGVLRALVSLASMVRSL